VNPLSRLPANAETSAHARQLLASYFDPTRLVRAASLSHGNRAVYLKLECELPTGSFKVRGAVYSLSLNLERRACAEVVAASTGNHGAAVAYAARLLGVRATIVLPRNPNPVKAARIVELGGRLIEHGTDLTEAIDHAATYAEEHGAFFLHDATDPDIPGGTATIAMETLDQLPSTGAIYVPVGDTALIRGVALAAKRRRPSIQIVGVQAARAAAYAMSWRTGTVVLTGSADTIADGLAVRRPLSGNVAAIRALVDDMRLVTEEQLRAAIHFLYAREQIVAEPAGAAAVAALLGEPDGQTTGTVVLIVSGSNVAPDLHPLTHA
jgi:threonine dehydratase